MSVIDLLITIIVVTILVTIALGVMTYIAYKLRMARRPVQLSDESAAHYFVLHQPTQVTDSGEADVS
jgi:Tfp pilus assembly protein PilE